MKRPDNALKHIDSLRSVLATGQWDATFALVSIESKIAPAFAWSFAVALHRIASLATYWDVAQIALPTCKRIHDSWKIEFLSAIHFNTHLANTLGRHYHHRCSVTARFVRREFRMPDQKKRKHFSKKSKEISLTNLLVSSISARIERQLPRLPKQFPPTVTLSLSHDGPSSFVWKVNGEWIILLGQHKATCEGNRRKKIPCSEQTWAAVDHNNVSVCLLCKPQAIDYVRVYICAPCIHRSVYTCPLWFLTDFYAEKKNKNRHHRAIEWRRGKIRNYIRVDTSLKFIDR